MAKLVDEAELLYRDRLAPITSSIGFLEAEYQLAVSEFTQWTREIASEQVTVESRAVAGSLEQVFSALLPLRTGSSTRKLLIPTVGRWTAFLDNRFRGTDPAALGYLAERLNCRTLWLVAIPNTLLGSGIPRRGRAGALILELYGPEIVGNQNVVREIRLQNNAGKWEFFLEGTPLHFEERDIYRKRKKTERFTFGMMKRYLAELGLHPFDADFYDVAGSGGATLIELSGYPSSSAREVSLAEARRMNGLDE